MVSGKPSPMKALLNVHLPDDKGFAQVAGAWFERASRELAPGAWDELQSSVPLATEPEAPTDAYGVAGGVWAYLEVLPRPGQGPGWTALYAPETFGDAVEALRRRPARAAFVLCRLRGDGSMGTDDVQAMTVSVSTERADPSWVQLQVVSGLPEGDGDLRLPGVGERWAELVKSLAAETDVAFGHVCDDAGPYAGTALESTLRKISRLDGQRGAGERYLRGYSWITVVSRPVAERLGGVDQVVATGAFAQVERLPAGGLWLRATDRFIDYDEAAVRRVFLAVAPVLPAGVPEPEPAPEPAFRYRLVWEDADWYRQDGQRPWPPTTPLRMPTPPAIDGAGRLALTDEGYQLSFEREVGNAERVWQVLTEPTAILDWFGSTLPNSAPPCSVELEVGGRIVLPYPYPRPVGPRLRNDSTLAIVTALDPPHEFSYAMPGPDGPGSRCLWHLELTPTGRAVVSLTYTAQVNERIPGLLADWHCRLDAIASLLAGQRPDPSWWDQRWPDLHNSYRIAIGFPRIR